MTRYTYKMELEDESRRWARLAISDVMAGRTSQASFAAFSAGRLLRWSQQTFMPPRKDALAPRGFNPQRADCREELDATKDC